MSSYTKPDCKHCHCSKGLFIHTEPLHTHEDPLCHNCHREAPPGTQLSRCTGCSICKYCSQKCQQEAWLKGHGEMCEPMAFCRDNAAEVSGNPKAWADLMEWADFHHDSFMNTTLHAHLNETPDKTVLEAAADNFVLMAVWYRNDATLPVGKKFELRGIQYYAKDDPRFGPEVPANLSLYYDRAVELGKAQYGDAYRCTATYMLEVRFGPNDRFPRDGQTVCIPFTKHFAIDQKRAVAIETCLDPFQQLKENVDEGKKMRFCCGPLPGRGTCCCGGWTHEEPESPGVINHAHCNLGLFHSSDQLHTHPHCKNCYRMRRCEGNDMKLLRCGGCNITTYCSKACQKAHWRAGHKLVCREHSQSRDVAIRLSGNPLAWSHLAQWIEYHHTSLINAGIARYLTKKDKVPDVTAKYILHLSLQYKNDPALPFHRQFELVHGDLLPKDHPQGGPTYAEVFRERPGPVQLGKLEMGNLYWGTGAYILMVRFSRDSTVTVPFWKHFGIDKITARATPTCRGALVQLMENLHEGKRMHFCCGKLEGLPTCCCGGWTHEISGHQPKSGW